MTTKWLNLQSEVEKTLGRLLNAGELKTYRRLRREQPGLINPVDILAEIEPPLFLRGTRSQT
jgi:hypothetical protein